MRNAHSYITNFEDLDTFFKRVGKSQWKLFRGFHDRTKGKALIYSQSEDGMDVEESFALLQDMIQINCSPAGRFTVLIPTSPSGQGVTQWVQIGEISTGATYGGARVSGQPPGMIPEAKLQKEIDRERKMWDMERQLEDLAAAREANATWQEIIQDKVREIPAETVGAVLSGVIKQFTGQRVTLQGIQADQQEQTATRKEEEEHPTASDTPPSATSKGYEYNGDILLPILDDIRNEFDTEEAFLEFLSVLRNKFVEDPAMYKNLVNL